MSSRGKSSLANVRDARALKVALAVVMLLVGSGIAVYNADTLYLAGEQTLTSQLPATVTPNGANTFMLMTTDGNGEPVADAVYTVELVQGNETLVSQSGRTDSRGFAAPVVNFPAFIGEAELRIITGDQVLSRTVKPVATSHIFLTTDKPIYQPGQDVHVRVLVLRGDSVAAGSDAVFEVKTPDGDLVLRKTRQLNEFGVAALDYPLSDQLPLGDYEFKVTVDGQEAVRNVKVDEYVLPRFEIIVGEMKPWYTTSEDIEGFILAKYFFGQLVEGTARLDINLFTGTNWTPVQSFPELDLVNGSYEFDATEWVITEAIVDEFGRRGPDSVLLEFNFTVTDTGDHEEHESYIVTYAKQPIVVSALADTNVAGETSIYYIVARFPDGGPVPEAKVTYWFDKNKDRARTTTTDERGVAALAFRYSDEKDYMHIEVTKDIYTGKTDLALDEAGGLKVVPDKASYEVGDTAQLAILYTGQGATDLVYYDVVADGFTIATGHMSMRGDKGTLEIPVTSDFGRLTSIRVYKVERNFNIARDVAVIGVAKEGDLDIDISPDSDTYLPQQPVDIEVRVTRDGDGVAAVLGVSIVDNAVFELGSRFTGFEEVLAGLLPQYSDPIYQFMGYIFVGDTAMPTESLNEWRRLEAAPVETTGKEQGDAAASLEDRAVAAYWTILAGIGIFVLVAFAALGPRTKQARVIAVVTMLLIVSLGAASLVIQRQADDEDFGDFAGQGDWFGQPANRELDEDGGVLPPFAGGGDADKNARGGSGNGGVDITDDGYTLPTKPGIVRQFFPETWAWIPVLPTDDDGTASLHLTSPDSITSWDVSVIASTKDALVGVAHENVTVFQEFFVEPDLPAKAFLGDRFPLKVQVHNYGEATDVLVTLQDAEWFDIVGPRELTVYLGTGEVGSVEFTIELTQVGVHELTVTGESWWDDPVKGFRDTVVRPLRVKPVGEKVTDLFSGRISPGDELWYNLTMLPELIESSEDAWVKLQGGVEAAVIEGAESFIHYVSGCGEQSLSTLSIDVLAFRTVREGELDEAKLLEFEMIVNQGIIHELQYLVKADNGKGRGIVWFPGDPDAHPWLTSWGVITFKDAQLAGFTVDQAIIDDMQEWLLSQQKEDGSWVFPEWGIYEFNNPKLRSKTLATTAYVAHSLVYSGVPADDAAIQKALSYIKDEVEEDEYWDDPYVLALSLKVLASAGEGRTTLGSSIADRLHELRTEENGTTFWGSSTNMISNEVFGERFDAWGMWDRNPGFVIEATGYATQALYLAGKHASDVDGGLKFLLDHRNSMGGFFSTQDTVVAFQTIYEVSTKQAPVDIQVEVIVGGESLWTLDMDDTNRDLTYLYDLRPHLDADTTEVHLRATGEGFCMFQVYLEQWVPWGTPVGDEPLELLIDGPTGAVQAGGTYTYDVTVRNNQDRTVKMALVELVAPVGMSFTADSFEGLMDSGEVDNIEFDDDMVRLYINDLNKTRPVSFTYRLTAEDEARVTMAGNRVFDMYNALIEMELPPMEIDIGPPPRA